MDENCALLMCFFFLSNLQQCSFLTRIKSSFSLGRKELAETCAEVFSLIESFSLVLVYSLILAVIFEDSFRIL